MPNPHARVIPWALGLLLAAGPAVRAELGEPRGSGGGKGNMEERFDKMKQELGLSDDQAQKLKAHRESQRREAEALWKDVKAKQDALRAELEKPTLDEARVKTLQAEVKAAHGKLADHRLEGILYVRKVLTPEQFAKFQTLGKEHRKEWMEKGGRRGPMGGARHGRGDQGDEDMPEPPMGEK